VLVDGFAAAAWRTDRARKTTALAVTPFEALSKADTLAVEAEAARLLAFLAPGDVHEVRFDTAS
jgi:hypothetical protein